MAGRGRRKLVGPSVNYFELPRRSLQQLCKKYGFPANKTNQQMAEFLVGHFNSEEYLSRDGALDSPAPKARSKLRQTSDTEMTESSQATENSLPTISESPLLAVSDTPEANLSSPSALGAPHVDGGPFGSEVEQTDLVDRTQVVCPEKAASTPTKMDFCVATPESSLQPHNEPGQDSPLPLSVMPYVCPVSPSEEFYVSNNSGVKLFVDLNNDSLPRLDLRVPGDNNLNISICGDKRRDYQAWAGPPALVTDRMQDDILGSFRTLRGTERNVPLVVKQTASSMGGRLMEGSSQDEEMKRLVQATLSPRITICTPLKSSVFSPKSALKVSFLNPAIFPSPRSIGCLVSECQRSDVVREWRTDEKHVRALEDKYGPIESIPKPSEEEGSTDDDIPVRTLVENAVSHSSLQNEGIWEPIERTQQCSADIENPPEGVVRRVVQIYEEERLSGATSSSSRKDSYKSSPFVKSNRVAKQLRASQLGQARRVGVLSTKRKIPVRMVSPSTAGVIGDGASSSLVPRSTTDSAVLTSAISIVVVDHETTVARVPPSDRPVVAAMITSSTEDYFEGVVRIDSVSNPLSGPTTEIITHDFGNNVRASNSLVMVDTNPDPGADVCSKESAVTMPLLLSLPSVGEGVPGESKIRSPATESTELEVIDSEPLQTESVSPEVTTRQMEGLPEDQEQDIVMGNAQEDEKSRLDGATKLQTTIEESVTNFSWMHKPVQLPNRKLVNQKLKKKIGNPSSANGRQSERLVAEDPANPNKGQVTKIDDESAGHTDVLRIINAGEEVQAKMSAATDVFNPQPSADQIHEPCGGRMDTGAQSISIEEKDECKRTTVLGLLEMNSPQIKTPPRKVSSLLDIDFTKIGDRTEIEKPIVLSSLEAFQESGGKENYANCIVHGKDNERLRRHQDQHKTPLTGKSKAKALRAAEMKAANLREHILRTRRGMGIFDDASHGALSPHPSPLKQGTMTNRLL